MCRQGSLQCLAEAIRDILDLMVKSLHLLLMCAERVVDGLNGVFRGR